MNVIVLQLFVSLMLVVSSVLLFVVSIRQRDHDHADRLSLFPLENDDPAQSAADDRRSKPVLSGVEGTSLSPPHDPSTSLRVNG